MGSNFGAHRSIQAINLAGFQLIEIRVPVFCFFFWPLLMLKSLSYARPKLSHSQTTEKKKREIKIVVPIKATTPG